MKTVVVYKSTTGYTKKYADWISSELNADIYEHSKIHSKKLCTYDTIIYGGSLHAVGIIGAKLITNNLNILKNKKLIVFATGASPFREKTILEIKNKNFTQEEQEYIHFYYFRGGFNYNKLNIFDKILMTLLRLKLKTKKNLTPDEKGMLAIYNKPVNYTRKSNIDDLISFVNS